MTGNSHTELKKRSIERERENNSVNGSLVLVPVLVTEDTEKPLEKKLACKD